MKKLLSAPRSWKEQGSILWGALRGTEDTLISEFESEELWEYKFLLFYPIFFFFCNLFWCKQIMKGLCSYSNKKNTRGYKIDCFIFWLSNKNALKDYWTLITVFYITCKFMEDWHNQKQAYHTIETEYPVLNK